MAGNGIGVTFIPSEANQMAQGPGRGSAEGDLSAGRSSDLGQAFKILSLQLPRVVSAAAPTSPDLLTNDGAAGLRTAPPKAMVPPAGNVSINGQPNVTQAPSMTDPMAAVFAALLRSLQAGSASPVGGTDLLSSIFGVGAPSAGHTAVRFGDGTDRSTPQIPDGVTNDWPMPGLAMSGGSVSAPAAVDTTPMEAPAQDYQSWAGSY